MSSRKGPSNRARAAKASRPAFVHTLSPRSETRVASLTRRRAGWLRLRAGRKLLTIADASSLAQLPIELPSSGREYLREFADSWRRVHALLTEDDITQRLKKASLILIGDYHALPASQIYVAELLRRLYRLGIGVRQDGPALALECFYSSQQRWLDRWWNAWMDTRQLLVRTAFEHQWGYGPEPYTQMLLAARQWGSGVFGLDLNPRSGFCRLAERDRHFAERLAAVRRRMPGVQIVALVGESHLAPNHLPELIARRLPREDCVLLFQNLDAIFCKVVQRCGELRPAQIGPNAFCVFTAHPTEKYECFRRYLEAQAA